MSVWMSVLLMASLWIPGGGGMEGTPALGTPPAGVVMSEPGAQPQEMEPIDVNSASAEELQEVPGIGPAIAGRIVEFRQEHGRFERLEDLLHVRGIGARTLEQIRPYLTVGDDGDGESARQVRR